MNNNQLSSYMVYMAIDGWVISKTDYNDNNELQSVEFVIKRRFGSNAFLFSLIFCIFLGVGVFYWLSEILVYYLFKKDIYLTINAGEVENGDAAIKEKETLEIHIRQKMVFRFLVFFLFAVLSIIYFSVLITKFNL